MNELVAAAKAVIDLYDYTGTEEECEAVNRLCDAVERVETQEVVGFAEWWDKNADLKYKFVPIGQANQLWNAASIAAQKVERERVRSIIWGMYKTLGITWTPEWIQCVNVMMEKIDE